MLFCWLLLIAFLTSFAFAVEPHISSVAALPSQDTLLAGSARSRTPIVPVSEPILFVPATATAPLFGVLAPTSSQGTSSQASTGPSAGAKLFNSNNPGKWPRPRHTLDIRGTLLYLTILDYGIPVAPTLKEDIITNLGLIIVDINHGGDPGQILSTVTYTKSIVSFEYAHRVSLSPYGVSRREVSLVLETIGGLILADGPRRIQIAFLSRGNFLVGEFALKYGDLGVPGSSSMPQSPQNSSLASAH